MNIPDLKPLKMRFSYMLEPDQGRAIITPDHIPEWIPDGDERAALIETQDGLGVVIHDGGCELFIGYQPVEGEGDDLTWTGERFAKIITLPANDEWAVALSYQDGNFDATLI